MPFGDRHHAPPAPRRRPLPKAVARVAALVTVAVLGAGCSTATVEGTAIGAPTTTAPPTTVPPTTSTTRPPATTAPSTPTTGGGQKGTVNWQPCGVVYQCAKVAVPVDYANPEGPKIELALRKFPGRNPKGTLFVNPGGPGGSGYDFVGSAGPLLSSAVQGTYDVVGWDPRGVARSQPVECLNGTAMDEYVAIDSTPDTPAEEKALIDGSKRFGQACADNSGALLPHMGTPNVARDLDRLREAVGDDKLTYIGFSYGTLIGARYAELFPDKARALVLDGAVHPTADFLTLAVEQGKGFDSAMNAFLADCQKKGSACAWQPGGDLKVAFKALSDKVDASPLPTASGRTVGPSEFFNGVADPLYAQDSWPSLARALQAASQGNGAPLLVLNDHFVRRQPNGNYENGQAANAAVNCVDRPLLSKDVGLIKAKVVEAQRAGGLMSPAVIWSAVGCLDWPVPPTSTTAPLKVNGAPPVLIVGTTNDPATPYVWSQEMQRQIPGSVLLTREGEGHVAFFYSACIRTKVGEYLVTGTPPPANTVC